MRSCVPRAEPDRDASPRTNSFLCRSTPFLIMAGGRRKATNRSQKESRELREEDEKG